MTTRDLTAAYFQQTISANSNVLVYFWAPLCAPCDLFTPTYEASSRKHFDVVHGKVNIETEKDLASIAGVKLLPTLMAFKKASWSSNKPASPIPRSWTIWCNNSGHTPSSPRPAKVSALEQRLHPEALRQA